METTCSFKLMEKSVFNFVMVQCYGHKLPSAPQAFLDRGDASNSNVSEGTGRMRRGWWGAPCQVRSEALGGKSIINALNIELRWGLAPLQYGPLAQHISMLTIRFWEIRVLVYFGNQAMVPSNGAL